MTIKLNIQTKHESRRIPILWIHHAWVVDLEAPPHNRACEDVETGLEPAPCDQVCLPWRGTGKTAENPNRRLIHPWTVPTTGPCQRDARQPVVLKRLRHTLN